MTTGIRRRENFAIYRSADETAGNSAQRPSSENLRGSLAIPDGFDASAVDSTVDRPPTNLSQQVGRLLYSNETSSRREEREEAICNALGITYDDEYQDFISFKEAIAQALSRYKSIYARQLSNS